MSSLAIQTHTFSYNNHKSIFNSQEKLPYKTVLLNGNILSNSLHYYICVASVLVHNFCIFLFWLARAFLSWPTTRGWVGFSNYTCCNSLSPKRGKNILILIAIWVADSLSYVLFSSS